jgi:hypothetical protein
VILIGDSFSFEGVSDYWLRFSIRSLRLVLGLGAWACLENAGMGQGPPLHDALHQLPLREVRAWASGKRFSEAQSALARGIETVPMIELVQTLAVGPVMNETFLKLWINESVMRYELRSKFACLQQSIVVHRLSQGICVLNVGQGLCKQRCLALLIAWSEDLHGSPLRVEGTLPSRLAAAGLAVAIIAFHRSVVLVLSRLRASGLGLDFALGGRSVASQPLLQLLALLEDAEF